MGKRAIVIAAAVCVSGLLCGFVFSRLITSVAFEGDALTVEPSIQVLAKSRRQGDVLHVPFALQNRLDQEVTVSSLTTSCGCTAVSTGDGRLAVPFRMRPHEILPVSLDINTGGRVGPLAFRFEATGERAGTTWAPVIGQVEVMLLGTLRATPETIIFRDAVAGKTVAASVELADMLPGDGCRVKELTSSRPEAFRLRLTDGSGASDAFGTGVTAHVRQRLQVEYTPSEAAGRVQETITVIPKGADCRPIEIRVFCELATSGIRFDPSALTISIEPSRQVNWRRVVRCRLEDSHQSIEIGKVPDDLTVRLIGNSGLNRLVEISSKQRPPESVTDEKIVFRVRGNDISLPIVYLRTPGSSDLTSRAK
jgi:hypothetical protein